MSYPSGLPTKQVSFGSAVVLEGGAPLAMRVTISASRSLVHRPSGSPLIRVSTQFSSMGAGNGVVDLPVCDLPNMGAGDGTSIVLDSAHPVTHLYSALINYYTDDTFRTVIQGATRTVGPFALLSSSPAVSDVDDLLVGSPPPLPGEAVVIPAQYTAQGLQALGLPGNADELTASFASQMDITGKSVAQINAWLSGGGIRRMVGAATITAPLVVVSNTLLDASGATITQASGATSNMLNNAAVTAARTVMDVVTTAASATITSSSAAFVAGDVGKTVWVWKGKADGGVHETAIASVTNGTTAVLAAAVPVELSAATVSIGPRDENITVVGGTWVHNYGGTGHLGHGIKFRRASNIVVRDLVWNQSVNRGYAINFADCRGFRVSGIHYDTLSDGVHLNGPCSRGVIRDLTGYTRDDTVSITPDDWVGMNDTWGDVTDILIENIQPRLSDNTIVKILGGSATHSTAAERITVRKVGGYATNVAQGFGGAVCIGDDTGQPGTLGGYVNAVRVYDVGARVPSDKYLLHLNGSNLGNVEIDGIVISNPNATAAAIGIGSSTAGAAARLITLRNIIITAASSTSPITITHPGLKRLVIDTMEVQGRATTSNSATIVSFSGAQNNIGTVEISRVRMEAVAGHIIGVAGTIGLLVLRDCHHTLSTTGGGSILNFNASTVASVVMSGCSLTAPAGTSSNLLRAQDAGAALTNVSIAQYRMTNGGAPVGASTVGTVISTLTLADGVFSGGTFGVADLCTTTVLTLANLVGIGTASANAMNLRATAVITLHVSGTEFGSRTIQGTAGYSLSAKSSGVRCSLDLITTKTKGDQAYNTNAALSCGVGPVVYTGTAWKSLIDGTTY